MIKYKAQLEPHVFEALSRLLEELAENLSADRIIEANSKLNAKKCFDQQFQIALKKSLKDCATKISSIQIKPRRYIKSHRSFGVEVKDALRQSLLEISQTLSEEEIIAANRFFKLEGTFGPNLQEALRISLFGSLMPQQSTPPSPIFSSTEKVNPPHESCISYTPIASEINRDASTSPTDSTIENPEPLVQKFIDERLKRRQSQSPNESPTDVSRPDGYEQHAGQVDDHSIPFVNNGPEPLSVNERALLMNKNNLTKSSDGKANIPKMNISNDQKNSTAVTSKPNNKQWIGGLAVVASTVAKAISKIQDSPKRTNNKNDSQVDNADAKSITVASKPAIHSNSSEDNAIRPSSYPQSRSSESQATVPKLIAPENFDHGVESDSEDDFGTIISWDETCGGMDSKLDKMVLQSFNRSRTPRNDTTSDRRKSRSREFFDAPSFYDTMNSGSISRSSNARYDSTHTSPQDVVSNITALAPDSDSSRLIPYVDLTAPPTTTRNSEVTTSTEIPSFQDIFQPIDSETSARLPFSNEDRSPSTSLEDRQQSATMTESSMAGTAKLFQHSSSSSTYRSSKGGSISKDDALKSALQILKKSLGNPVIQEDSIRSVVAMLEDVLLQSSLSSSMYSFISHDKGPEQSSQITQVGSTGIDYEHAPLLSSSSHDTDKASSQKDRRFSHGSSHRRSEPALFGSEVMDDIKNNGLKRIDETSPAPTCSIQSKKSILSFGEMVSSSTHVERTSASNSDVQGSSSHQRASQMFTEDAVVVEHIVRERQLSNASVPAYTPAEGRRIFPPLEQLTTDYSNGSFPVTPKYSNSILNQSALHSRSVYVPGSSESVEQLLSYKSNVGRSFEPKIYGSADYYVQDHRNSLVYSAAIQNNEQNFSSNHKNYQENNFDWNVRPLNRSQHREVAEKQNPSIDHVWRGHTNESEYGVDMNITIDSLTSSPFRNLTTKQPQSPRLHGTKLPSESINLTRPSSFMNRESSSMMNNSQLPWDQSPRTRAFENSSNPMPGLQLQSAESGQFPYEEQYKLHQFPARPHSYNEEWHSHGGSSDRVITDHSNVHVDLPETVNPLAMRNKVSSPNYSSYFDPHIQSFSSPHRSLHQQSQPHSLPPFPHHKFPTQSLSQPRQQLRTSIEQADYYQTPPQQQQSELMYHDITIEQLSTTSSITDDSPSDYQSESIDEPLMPIDFPYQRSHHPSNYQQRESFYYSSTLRNYDKRSDSQDRFSRGSGSGLDFVSKQISRTDSRQQLSHPSGGINAVRTVKGRWACSKCTLINNPNFLVCEVCGSVRNDLK